MNPESPQTPREQLETRVTALLLGELSTEDADALRQIIARDPELAALEQRLRQTIELIRETAFNPAETALPQPSSLKLSEARRQKLLAEFKTVAPKEFVRPRRAADKWLLPVAAAACIFLLAALAVPNYQRARYTSERNAIMNRLRMIEGAKQTWALETKASPDAVPTMSDIRPYFGRATSDPLDGVEGEKYSIGKVNESPTVELETRGLKRLFGGRTQVDLNFDFENQGTHAMAATPAPVTTWGSAPPSSAAASGSSNVFSVEVVGYINVANRDGFKLESTTPAAALAPATPPPARQKIVLPSVESQAEIDSFGIRPVDGNARPVELALLSDGSVKSSAANSFGESRDRSAEVPKSGQVNSAGYFSFNDSIGGGQRGGATFGSGSSGVPQPTGGGAGSGGRGGGGGIGGAGGFGGAVDGRDVAAGQSDLQSGAGLVTGLAAAKGAAETPASTVHSAGFVQLANRWAFNDGSETDAATKLGVVPQPVPDVTLKGLSSPNTTSAILSGKELASSSANPAGYFPGTAYPATGVIPGTTTLLPPATLPAQGEVAKVDAADTVTFANAGTLRLQLSATNHFSGSSAGTLSSDIWAKNEPAAAAKEVAQQNGVVMNFANVSEENRAYFRRELERAAKDKTALLGDVPMLGMAFRSDDIVQADELSRKRVAGEQALGRVEQNVNGRSSSTRGTSANEAEVMFDTVAAMETGTARTPAFADANAIPSTTQRVPVFTLNNADSAQVQTMLTDLFQSGGVAQQTNPLQQRGTPIHMYRFQDDAPVLNKQLAEAKSAEVSTGVHVNGTLQPKAEKDSLDLAGSTSSSAYTEKRNELNRLERLREVTALRTFQERVESAMPKTSMVEIVRTAEADAAKSPSLSDRFGRLITGDVTRTASVKVQRDAPDRPGVEGASAVSAIYDPYFTKTEFEVMESEPVLDKVIEKLKLNDAWTAKRGLNNKLSTPETRELLRKKIELQPVKDTSLIDIKVKDDKPEEAARIANAVAEAYRDYRTEVRQKLLTNAMASFQGVIAEQDKKIAQAKQELALLQPKAVDQQPDAPAAKSAQPPPVPQPEVMARENAFSTFSLNVADVSFKLAAASLEKGAMPEAASIRTEEFINAFDYRDPEPTPGTPVGFAWERARYPFAHNRDLLRFSLKTAAAGRQPGRPLNVVLVLDNSGSMERADRVRIIQEALRVLATQLRPEDKLSVVTFARTPRLWVDGISGSKAGEVLELVAGITPEGGTDLESAINLGYATALRHYLPTGVNRVVLLTDGAANLGNVDPTALKQVVERNRKQGLALDCFGIGWEGYNDDLLEQLSRNGDGRYGFINSPEEAATTFVAQLAGALRVAASDVKVQVEFNPNRVKSWRQIGYAKHQLTKEQFRDNTVDAAEIGAAESGNALYTVETDPAGEGPIATVRVRYKVPGTAVYREQEWAVPFNGGAPSLDQAAASLRLAATAAAFSEWLASSPFAAEVTPDGLLGQLSGVPDTYGADARPRQLEWMIRQAKSISGK